MCHQALERCAQKTLPQVTRKMLWEIEPEHPRETQDLPKKWSLSKKVGALAAAVVVLILAIYAMLNGRDIKAPLPGADISLTTSKDIPRASTPQIPPAPITEAAEPKVLISTTYRLTPKDVNLTKVAAKHYSDNKTIGFAAIILANPQITNEDLILPGKEIFLPKVKAKRKIILLNDNQHYLLYKRYSDVSTFEKTISKLNQRQVRFKHRKTHNIAVGNIYRIYLGGYEREDDLMNALTVAEKR